MSDQAPSDGLPAHLPGSTLDASAAARCPVRVQLNVLQPCEPAPTPPDLQLRIDHGTEYEHHVFDRLQTLHPQATFVDRSLPNDQREGATHEAMKTGALLIVGGRLPTNRWTRRAGEPDVLVRHGSQRIEHTWRYLPVDIKSHRTLTPQVTNAQKAARVSTLAKPGFEFATSVSLVVVRHRREDALRLAHYRRMLDQLGHDAEIDAAGVIGISDHIAWYRLDEPIWKTPPTARARTKMRTSMQVYDVEFDFRCDVATAAEEGEDADLLVEPMWCSECPSCPWRPHCEPILRDGDGDVSLLPRVDYRRWRELRSLSIRTRRDLVTNVPVTSARLAKVFGGPRISQLRVDAAAASPSTPVAELVKGARQQAALAEADIHVAGDVPAIPAISDQLSRSEALLGHRVAAEAALSPEPFLFLGDATGFAVPRADIEIDIDMENSVDDRVYLWGALITDRTGAAPQSGYRPTADWSPMFDALERSVFEDFWSWLSTVRLEAQRRSLTFRAYCWHAAAENRRLRELASHDERLASAVADFIDSEEWVDLEQVWRSRATTGEGSGLKLVAPLSGFSWRAADADGANSIVYYERAASGDASARRWLLDYNEDDCRATASLRDWMASEWPESQVPAST